MKALIFNLFAITVLVSTACKKEEKEEPQPEPQPVFVFTEQRQPDVKSIYNIELYNQALDTATTTELYNFYNITQQKYSNSLDFPIELAYVYSEKSSGYIIHTIASAKSGYLSLYHDVPLSNTTYVDFFEIDDDYSSLIFDTIQYSESVTAIFKKKAKIRDWQIQSDGFGWIKGEILGFKLANGKQGLIKLKATPTGSQDDKGIVSVGKIVFDIKMEK